MGVGDSWARDPEQMEEQGAWGSRPLTYRSMWMISACAAMCSTRALRGTFQNHFWDQVWRSGSWSTCCPTSSACTGGSSTATSCSTFFLFSLCSWWQRALSSGIAGVKDTCKSNARMKKMASAQDGHVVKCMRHLAGSENRALLRSCRSNGDPRALS